VPDHSYIKWRDLHPDEVKGRPIGKGNCFCGFTRQGSPTDTILNVVQPGFRGTQHQQRTVCSLEDLDHGDRDGGDKPQIFSVFNDHA
jgi:hypothetical protein